LNQVNLLEGKRNMIRKNDTSVVNFNVIKETHFTQNKQKKNLPFRDLAGAPTINEEQSDDQKEGSRKKTSYNYDLFPPSPSGRKKSKVGLNSALIR